ncbi:TonB-dependent receptor [Roseimarinus sediminis]|uniref:TonB-dependent receptor n=1 Tax=Roseimarinus sediminis TaxID=1610899 RepID=UPI003D230DAE
MKTPILIVLIFCFSSLAGQTKIEGEVKAKNGEPLTGVNIYIEGTYNGASSDEDGHFHFSISDKGKKKLVASFIGYQSWSGTIDASADVEISIVLHESVNTLDAVTITAGTFAVDDQKRAAILEPLDIYTTASANGDIMAAMRTLPGAQAAADDGRLLVRGGDAYESKTYIDGLLAAKPYYSKTPDVATRGRFTPSLFEGVLFNTGGYSAEYGQALSSVLILNSSDVAVKNSAGLSLMTIGAEANLTKAMKNSSLMASASYINMGPFHKLVNSYIDWTKPVEAINLTSTYRYKPSSTGLLKAFATYEWGDMAYRIPNGNNEALTIENKGKSGYANVNYRDCMGEKSCFRTGLSGTYENNGVVIAGNHIETLDLTLEARYAMVHELSEKIVLTWGVSDTYTNYQQAIKTPEFPEIDLHFTDHTLGTFAESEIKFSKYFAVRPGIRAEYASLMKRASLAPRLAMAVKTSKSSQFSAAWGRYYQNPETDYLKFNSDLYFENATHYITGWQAGSVQTRLFRIESYYKTYDKLVTWEGINEYFPMNISNSGFGQSAGIDLFWRDRKSIKNLDYWLTYSFVDTERKYRNYPEAVTPDFISNHNFSAVSKYWIHKISTQAGASYTFASARRYDDPSSTQFMDGRTGCYGDLSLNLSHIFFLGDQYSVLYASVNNVLGRENVFGYRPSGNADAQGNYTLVPVKQDTKRFFFIGLFLSF